ncbi:holliday junction resolvase [Bacillus phage 056SW001B]|uniref:Holliday junction resolvase n=1 Tax=Bacillus phage 056SW001B TaxID=2601663 RepID=A0A5P8PIP3_9CAUD|nr:holliday junction resolvase [Bacillus phage 276BB001]QFG05970.1 holliday junction resolvase [Bacillus phage 280BB001]QFR56515.1 holliday junction resolvase [Bacillus phage 056SW001B]QZA70119.1 holliday junction resolvase [Bacillus phage 274BB002]
MIKRNKFNNKKVEIDGIVFDSAMEAKYYEYLKEEHKHGRVAFFDLQPRYTLQPSFKKRGKLFRAIDYKADFEVHYPNGDYVTVDVKGFETADFKIKRKLFEKAYPQELKLITYSKIDGGWIEIDDLKKARKERKKAKEEKAKNL